ncbi:MAG: glycosyltransferase 87 family protein [Archangium sp.]
MKERRISEWWFVLGGFVAALVIRTAPRGMAQVVDYDEGVYVAGAWALRHGFLPWRDFVFLHPPGILLWLAPLTVAGPKLALTLGRLLSSIAGAANAVLAGRLVGGWGGLVAGLWLATWWEGVTADRGVFLEPLMTCAGLIALTLAKAPREWDPSTVTLQRRRRRARWAGVAAGIAILFKLWGGLWFVGAWLLVEKEHRRSLLFGASVALAIGLVPFAVPAPEEMLFQLIRVHSLRPPDGDLELLTRLREMFVSRSLDATILIVLALPFSMVGPSRKLARVALLGAALLVAAFLLTPAWWNQYDAALAPFLALLLGTGTHAVVTRIGARGWLAAVLALLLGARHFTAAVATPGSRREQQTIADTLPAKSCAFEVYELVLRDEGPPLVPPILIDSYGQALRDGARAEKRFPSANELFASDASQVTYRQQLANCATVRTGWRGDWQLNAATKQTLAEQFSDRGDGVWLRR